MTQQTFGNRLAEARRRRGLTLEQVHLQLRISPAILESLEIGDFYHMPLKGHARNMVSAYARYLGLNPEDVTKQFLSEYRDFEGREARHSSTPLGSSVTNSGRYEAQPIPPSYTGTNKRAESQGVRSMWNKPIPRSELSRGYDSRSQSAHRVATAASRRNVQTGVEKPSAPRRQTGGSYTPRPGLLSRFFGSLFGNPIALVTVLVLVIVVLLVAWAMLANSCKKQGEERNITASGGAVVTGETPPEDTTATDGTGETPAEGQENADDARYGPFELVVEQAAGTGPWVRVTVDEENVYEGTLSEKLNWEVTASCTVLTAQPDNVMVTRGGEAVTFEADDEGTYSVTLEVENKPSGEAGAAGTGDAAGTGGASDAAGAAGETNTNQGGE